MKTLLCCLGLGDAIALSGAAVALADTYGHVRFPCLARYWNSVQSIFINNPEVEVMVVPNMDAVVKMREHKGSIRAYEDEIPRDIDFFQMDHYRWIYEKLLFLPYDFRWNQCPIKLASRRVSQACFRDIEQYRFIHDDPERGFRIRMQDIKPLARTTVDAIDRWHRPHDLAMSILRYVDMIEYAAEVHVIDSAFFHLTESIQPKGKLFLHRYARPYYPVWNDYETRHAWEIVE